MKCGLVLRCQRVKTNTRLRGMVEKHLNKEQSFFTYEILSGVPGNSLYYSINDNLSFPMSWRFPQVICYSSCTHHLHIYSSIGKALEPVSTLRDSASLFVAGMGHSGLSLVPPGDSKIAV